MNVPSESRTTCPGGQDRIAAWIAAEALLAPSPSLAASTVAQIAARRGIPPSWVTPGRHAVARSGGSVQPPGFALARAGDRRHEGERRDDHGGQRATAPEHEHRAMLARWAPAGSGPAGRRPQGIEFGVPASYLALAGSVYDLVVPSGVTHGQGLAPKKAGFAER